METSLVKSNNSENNVLSKEKLYSLDMVEAVSGGNKEFIKKMVLLFIETIPKDVKQLSNSCASKDWAQVAKTAHKLKSTIDSMAIKSIKEVVRTIESNAKNQTSLEQVPALCDKITAVINECVVQLSAEIM